MTSVPVVDTVTPMIGNLGMSLQWSRATSYFSTLPMESDIQPVMAAVDCVPDAENRFKVYIRTQATHLSALCDMFALGGELNGPAIDATLPRLREFWCALFGSISDETPVQRKTSSIGPTGFFSCYEMAIGKPRIIPKIYISVARFPQSDAHVAQVMSRFVGSPHLSLSSRFTQAYSQDSFGGFQIELRSKSKAGLRGVLPSGHTTILLRRGF